MPKLTLKDIDIRLDEVIAESNSLASERKYLNDRLNAIELSVQAHAEGVQCVYEYAKKIEENFNIKEIQSFVKTIESYNLEKMKKEVKELEGFLESSYVRSLFHKFEDFKESILEILSQNLKIE